MAFRDSSDLEDLPVFYNVLLAVGNNAPNLKEDVLLVQFLLFETYSGKLKFAPFNTRPQGNMTVDGICGPITKNWILKFQLDIRFIGGNPLLDKRIDRAREVISSISRTVYTIISLNQIVKQVRPDFDNLDKAVDVPRELIPVFTQF